MTLRKTLLTLPVLTLVGLLGLQWVNWDATRRINRDVIFPNIKDLIMEGHKTTMKALVDSEATILARRIQALSTREKKIAAIIDETDPIRFFGDKSGYFFSYDLTGVRINVPTNKADNGKNLIALLDKNGSPFIKNLVEKAAAGGGYVTYHFEKPGQGVQPKLAYVKQIAGTDFLVGTGVYTDSVQINNVEADRASLEKKIASEQGKYGRDVIIAFALVLGLTLATALLLSRRVTASIKRIADQLGEASRQVTSAATEVSRQSQALAKGANEQAAAIEETTASLEEMAGMARRNTENAKQTDELAKLAKSAADGGSEDMRHMTDAINAINASSKDIAKIILTIDGIAFQTNILALNAAVEAARAGEAGMGFAVVADEVRNLAKRSADAARETTEKIESAVTKTSSGIEISRQVSDVLNTIVSRVQQVVGLAAEVATASNQQTASIQEISTAVRGIGDVTQGTAGNAEHSSASAQELNAQACAMQETVSELLSLVGGNSAS